MDTEKEDIGTNENEIQKKGSLVKVERQCKWKKWDIKREGLQIEG